MRIFKFFAHLKYVVLFSFKNFTSTFSSFFLYLFTVSSSLTVFVKYFCQFRSFFQGFFNITSHSWRLMVVTLNFVIGDVISINFSYVSLSSSTFLTTERFSKALVQLKLDIALFIFSIFAVL